LLLLYKKTSKSIIARAFLELETLQHKY